VSCDVEVLEALARGRLPPERASEASAHVRRCPACTEELAWLRAERALFDQRAQREPALPPEIWQNVERRIAERPRTRRIALAGALTLAAAAAALILIWHPPPPPPPAAATPVTRPRPDANRVLDAAEQEYRQAIGVLEGELASAQRRGAVLPRWRDDLSLARTVMADASGAAGRDPEARLRVLDGYAAYLRSLQTVVLAVEERTR
jgi:hypothetical protein